MIDDDLKSIFEDVRDPFEEQFGLAVLEVERAVWRAVDSPYVNDLDRFEREVKKALRSVLKKKLNELLGKD
jgi:hypothetical protein